MMLAAGEGRGTAMTTGRVVISAAVGLVAGFIFMVLVWGAGPAARFNT